MSSSNRNRDGAELPGWIDSFLSKPFFSACSNHEAPNNQLKRYCIDCDATLCNQCIDEGAHTSHEVQKVYKNGRDVAAPLEEIQNRLDCSDIQRYRCNKNLVIALHHSGSQNEGEGRCETCQRELMDPVHNNYCCIDCKVRASRRKTEGSNKRSRKGKHRWAPHF